jgi:iron(II)-dependent oxidoreductase
MLLLLASCGGGGGGEGAETAPGSRTIGTGRAADLPSGLVEEKGRIVNPKDGAFLVRIPDGYYPMGREGGPKEEVPAHEVFLDDAFLYETEVTRAMYARFLNETKTAYEGEQLARNAGSWSAAEGTSLLPVTNLTWSESRAYAEWAGGDLPLEVQWEAAARGTGEGPFPWGDAPATAERALLGAGKDGAAGPVRALPLGRSPFGCFGMCGNAAEWCRDAFDAGAYGTRGSMARNPWRDDPEAYSRVIRGGGFVSPPKTATVTARTGLDPDVRLPWVGFRVVVEAE